MVVNPIRGRNVGEALALLRVMPRGAAKVVEKLLKSAVANAEQKDLGDPDELWIKRVFVDQGPTLKRFKAAPQGRARPIKKRMSHITVVVGARENARGAMSGPGDKKGKA